MKESVFFVILVAIAVLQSMCSQSNDHVSLYLHPIEQNHKWGFVNQYDSVVI